MFNKIFPKIHAEGYKFLVIAGIITIIFYIFSSFLGLIGLVLTIWVYYFFRDPDRIIINDDNYLVSPADGEVIKVEEVDGPKELGLEKVPTVTVKLSKEKAAMYRIIDNKLSEEAIWDKFLLEMEVSDLPFDEWDFDFTDTTEDIIEEIQSVRETTGIEATDQQKKLIFLYTNPTKYSKHFDKIQAIKYEFGFDTDDQIVDYLLEKALGNSSKSNVVSRKS